MQNHFSQKGVRVLTTGDGSSTVQLPEMNVTYHSMHGARAESMHVFIKNGLDFILQKHGAVNILEVGLGTGLNLLLTILHSKNRVINYFAVEPFPLNDEILNEIEKNFPADEKIIYGKIHEAPWDQDVSVNENFSFRKIQKTFLEFKSDIKFHLVYFDAFAPTAQPEMWTEKIFSKLFSMMKNESALVTFCAKGEVKRTLKKCGFKVETLSGAPGKREMIRALKL